MERRSLVHWRDLIVDLVARDLKMRYRRSMLGLLWSLLNPLLLLAACLFLFQQVLNLRIQNYPLFVACAILPWSWFATTLLRAPPIVVDNRNLVCTPYFPAQVLPIVTSLAALAQFVCLLPVLFVLLALSRAPFGPALVVLPVLLGIQFLLSTGIAFLLAVAHVRWRDIRYFVAALLTVWFCLTPTFYDQSAVPERFRLAYRLNPMAQLVDAYRDILLHARPPNMLTIAILLLASLAIFMGGYNIFANRRHRFVEEL
jgi:lipopolysaccharide transport system permease protein